MRVLIYGINYAPELTGIGKYTGEMAADLAERGAEVEVITAPPYYPHWRVQEPYPSTKWITERRDGVTVHRCPLYVPEEVSGTKRILHEVTFVLSSLRFWIPRLFRRYDVIIAVSPPFHLGALPLLHQAIHGTPIVNHIQDLQVDAARDLGMIKNQALLGVLERFERWLLRSVNRVSSISEGMLSRLAAKRVPEENLISFPNWVDSRKVYPVSKDKSLRSKFGIAEGTKVVLYAGNLGEKQGIDAIPRVAAALRDREDILFLVVGEGGMKLQLVDICRQAGLDNVRFEPLQPIEQLSAMLASADVHLVLQKRAAGDLVMPSKLTNIVAVGGHAIVTAEEGTTLYKVVKEWKAGTVVEPEDDRALAAAILRAVDGEGREDSSGVEAFAKTLDRDQTLSSFHEKLQELSYVI